MYAVGAEEDCLMGEFNCECARMKAAYSRGIGRIEIYNERANQILAKIHEAALEQCPKCGPEKGHWVDVTQNQETETVMN